MTGPQILVAATGVLCVAFILRLVRQRQLRGKYSLLWLGAGFAGLLIGFVPGLLDDLADWLDVKYPPAILFVLAIAFLLLVLVHVSWELTRLEDRTRTLAQEIAMLRNETDGEAAPRNVDGDASPGPG